MTTAELRDHACAGMTDRDLAESALGMLEDLSLILDVHLPAWYTIGRRIDMGDAIEHAAALVDRMKAAEDAAEAAKWEQES